jgi:DNA-binding transcriptional regulator YhcF (GntR family)
MPESTFTRLPLYAQVEDALAERIASGRLAMGAQLPSEEELIREFGVSRTTIRTTIQNLVRQGLVEIRRGRGTFVASPKIVQELTELTGFVGHLGSKGVKKESTDLVADVGAFRAIELLYHSYLTGLILMLSSRAGPQRASEIVFKTFRRQQLARFLPGLKKLGLDSLPHAVACAQYHYLSNQLGGVKVEYVYESDRKAWIRYPPPRWIW